jgi:hypothetical protein
MTKAAPIDIADTSNAFRSLMFGSGEKRMKKLLMIIATINDVTHTYKSTTDWIRWKVSI